MFPYPALANARVFPIRFRNPNKPGRDVGPDAEGGGAASRPTWEAYDEGKKYLELGMIRPDELAEFVERSSVHASEPRHKWNAQMQINASILAKYTGCGPWWG